MVWRLEVPPHVAEVVRHLPPDVKLAVKAALRGLVLQPEMGERLQGNLAGLRKYRVRRYRTVYGLDRRSRTVRLFAVGHRRGVYEEAAAAR